MAAVLIPGGLWARGKTGNARIKVDIERQKGEIDRNIYGTSSSTSAAASYGGLYCEPGSPLSTRRGYRRDVLEATRALSHIAGALAGRQLRLGLPLGRHGPAGRTPDAHDLAWASESNAFGTDACVEW